MHCSELIHIKIVLLSQNVCLEAFQDDCWSYGSDTVLNRGLSSDFWWLKSANYVKFIQECNDVYGEVCLSQKHSQMG